MASLDIPAGFNTVDEYLNNLADRMQASQTFVESQSTSGDLPAPKEEEQVQNAPADDHDDVQVAPATDEAVHDEAVNDEAVNDEAVDDEDAEEGDEEDAEEGDIIYERDLRSNNKRDIDFTKVPVGAEVHVFANRYSGGYSYIVEESYEATLANKKIAKHQALILMRDRCKEVHAEEDEDLVLRTEITALRRMQSRTKKVNILVSLAEGHTRALESYEAQQLTDNTRVERSNERLSRVFQLNTMLLDVDDDAIKNARYNVLKPSAGKKKKRHGTNANNTPY